MGRYVGSAHDSNTPERKQKVWARQLWHKTLCWRKLSTQEGHPSLFSYPRVSNNMLRGIARTTSANFRQTTPMWWGSQHGEQSKRHYPPQTKTLCGWGLRGLAWVSYQSNGWPMMTYRLASQLWFADRGSHGADPSGKESRVEAKRICTKSSKQPVHLLRWAEWKQHGKHVSMNIAIGMSICNKGAHTYIHIYIYLFIYLLSNYISSYIHTYLHTYIYIHIHTYTYIYIHLHTYTYIYIHIHTYTYIYIHIHTYSNTYIYIHIHA